MSLFNEILKWIERVLPLRQRDAARRFFQSESVISAQGRTQFAEFKQVSA